MTCKYAYLSVPDKSNEREEKLSVLNLFYDAVMYNNPNCVWGVIWIEV